MDEGQVKYDESFFYKNEFVAKEIVNFVTLKFKQLQCIL